MRKNIRGTGIALPPATSCDDDAAAARRRVVSPAFTSSTSTAHRTMASAARHHMLVTTHGRIAVEERGRGDLPIFFIHGNSTCRSVFRKQFEGDLPDSHRLIAMDLPGHGDSSDAPDPHGSYTRPGYADAAAQVLAQMDVRAAIVVGWSLGGHIAIDLLDAYPGMRGLMLVGAPPVPRDGWARGFKAAIQNGAAARQHLRSEEIDGFVHTIFGAGADPALRAAVARADGLARKRVFEASKEGLGIDQLEAVETRGVPLAVVNGAQDPIVDLDYCDGVAYAHLWSGHCHRIEGAGHAPFWQEPLAFDQLLRRFASDVSRRDSVSMQRV